MEEPTMLMPTSILPDRLGINWGMSREQCLNLLNVTPLRQSPTYAIVRISVQGSLHEVCLLFDEHRGLQRIEVDLHVSRDFWDDYYPGEMEEITTEYLEHYRQAVERCRIVLGSPDFSGQWDTQGYPEDQTAANITYWTYPQGRSQIEFDHPDKEFPMVVRIASYPMPD